MKGFSVPPVNRFLLVIFVFCFVGLSALYFWEYNQPVTVGNVLLSLWGGTILSCLYAGIHIQTFEEDLTRKPSLTEILISILGGGLGFVSFISVSAVFGLIHAVPASATDKIQKAYYSGSFSFLCYMTCLIFIWSKYVVEDDTIVNMDGKNLYPKTKFSAYPFWNHKVNVYEKEISCLGTMEIGLIFSDGSKCRFKFTPDLELDIARMTSGNMNMGELSKLKDWLEPWIKGAVRDRAIHDSLQTFLQKWRTTETYLVGGFPIIWKGGAIHDLVLTD